MPEVITMLRKNARRDGLMEEVKGNKDELCRTEDPGSESQTLPVEMFQGGS